MRCYSAGVWSAVVWLVCCADGPAADLAKIDRTIHQEPAYQTTAPRYCLLAFGSDAKTRVWLVLDGDTVYVDRNGNGDLTDPGERVPMPPLKASKHPLFQEEREVDLGDIREGDRTHTGLVLEQVRARRDLQPKDRDQREFVRQSKDLPGGFIYYVRVSVDLSGPPGPKDRPAARVLQSAYGDGAGLLALGASSKDAPVIHFNGPLTLGLLPGQALIRGDKGAELRASITTPGLGNGATAYLYHSTREGLVAEGVHPVAEVEYPAGTAGKKPPAARVPLTQRC
jgi:hypothetical protein